VRIWDVDPGELCRAHLLGEHRELHALWTILTEDRRGYRSHPETRRWEGKLAALYRRHEALVEAMQARGYRHHSPLDRSLATGLERQDELIDDISTQRRMLLDKGCECFGRTAEHGDLEGA